jgi:XTP/dITP diphosphohydrolase
VSNLLLATANPAKLARLRWVVEGLGFRIVTPRDLDGSGRIDVAETGVDFAENAAGKAMAWSRAARNMPALATDGGLLIPALGPAWNAVTTRRNAGADAGDAERARHLLALMHGLHGEARHAIWHEAVAFASGEAEPRVWTEEGDGGYIVETYVPDGERTEFWTEAVRYYPAAGALYRDLDARQLEELGTVWPRLRRDIRAYLSALGDAVDGIRGDPTPAMSPRQGS